MEEENQLPLKRVELSLSKFNDVAIPHHLELLRQHKANILKYEEAGQLPLVRGEQAAAARAAARLRALLAELGALRARLRPTDRAAFDRRTQHARDLTLQAIMDYLGMIERSCSSLATPAPRRTRESSPMSIQRGSEPDTRVVSGSALSTDSVGVVAHAGWRADSVGVVAHAGWRADSVGVVAHAGWRADSEGVVAHAGRQAVDDDCDVPVLQLQLDDRELALAEREAALRGWSELQTELHALHGAWAATHAAAQAQREQVAAAAGRVGVAADNVEAARASLSAAEKLRAGAWGLGGAAVGGLLGGPLGLLAGAKAGALALLAGSALGYCGARMLGHRRQGQLAIQDRPANEDPPQEEKKTQ